MWPNPRFPADLVTFSEENLKIKFCKIVKNIFLKKTPLVAASAKSIAQK